MAHFAKVVDGKVTQVIVAEPEFFTTFVDSSPGEWIQHPITPLAVFTSLEAPRCVKITQASVIPMTVLVTPSFLLSLTLLGYSMSKLACGMLLLLILQTVSAMAGTRQPLTGLK